MDIFHKLLPLATGYFGVSSALYDFQGLVVIYGPAGGAWHINIEDEPRWYRGPATVVGAGLLEMDVILGNEDKFINNIAKVATELDRKFVALAGTPISEIIGTDLKGFARTLEARTGLPVFMVPTAGSEPYPEGASKAFLALADKFLEPPAATRAKSLNVLGAIHLSTGKQARIEPLFAALEQAGFSLTGIFSGVRPGRSDPLEGIRQAATAAGNLVISSSGLALANRLYEAYGIPAVVGMPVGRQALADAVALLSGQPLPTPAAPARIAPFRHALVIGEPVVSYGVKRCLTLDFGLPTVDVIAVTPSEALFADAPGRLGSLAQRGPDDLDTAAEPAIAARLADPAVDLVVADPCYRAPLDRDVRFIDLPHIALSARFHWDMPYGFAAEEGYRSFAEALFGPADRP